MSYNINEYIQKVNQINEEIKAIKSADCIMDYDTKTEIINFKKSIIAELSSLHNNVLASGIELSFDATGEKDER